ncbi:MAG: hypothetical protein GC154_13890 [bacterium]|nr:hypothetical protein [bacterium]
MTQLHDNHNPSGLRPPLWRRISWLTCAAWAAAADAFLWGVYFELGQTAASSTLASIHFFNNFGMTTYCLAGLTCVMAAGSALQQGVETGGWNDSERLLFQGGLIVGAVFFMTGLRFLWFGEWGWSDPLVHVIYQMISLALLLAFIAQGMRYELRNRNNEGGDDEE